MARAVASARQRWSPARVRRLRAPPRHPPSAAVAAVEDSAWPAAASRERTQKERPAGDTGVCGQKARPEAQMPTTGLAPRGPIGAAWFLPAPSPRRPGHRTLPGAAPGRPAFFLSCPAPSGTRTPALRAPLSLGASLVAGSLPPGPHREEAPRGQLPGCSACLHLAPGERIDFPLQGGARGLRNPTAAKQGTATVIVTVTDGLDPAPGAPSASARSWPGGGSRRESLPTHRTEEQRLPLGVRWGPRVRVGLSHHPVHVEDRAQLSSHGWSPATRAVRHTPGLGAPGTVHRREAVHSGTGSPPPGGESVLPRMPTGLTANGPMPGTLPSASVRTEGQYLPQELWGFGHSANEGTGTQYMLNKSR